MTAALGFLAATLSITVIGPQIWLSCRHRRTNGLSPTACWLAVGLNLCWLTFGLLIGDPAQILTNAVVGTGNTAVLLALLLARPELRSAGMLRRTAVGAAVLVALAVGSLASVVLLGADPAAAGTALGAVIGVVGALAALPQPLSLLRDRTQDVSGVSETRWRLGAGSCGSWVAYGWLIEQPTMWLSAGFGLMCALTVCATLRVRREGAAGGPITELWPTLIAATGRRADGYVCPAYARAVLVTA
jgi:uncharacterized protein with PQ loop repeat